jgi:hypothetical protein
VSAESATLFLTSISTFQAASLLLVSVFASGVASLLLAQITFSVGWPGAVAAFLALAGLTSLDAQTVRVDYSAMELTARFVIVPLAFASLLSGLIQSLGTL